MYVHKDGNLYGFCPGKATWDQGTVTLYQYLTLTAETGMMYTQGGIAEQPEWFVGLAAWFVPLYRQTVFYSRVRGVLGDGDNKRPVKDINRSGVKRRG